MSCNFCLFPELPVSNVIASIHSHVQRLTKFPLPSTKEKAITVEITLHRQKFLKLSHETRCGDIRDRIDAWLGLAYPAVAIKIDYLVSPQDILERVLAINLDKGTTYPRCPFAISSPPHDAT